QDCPCCTGRGIVKTAESMAIEVIRLLMLVRHREGVKRISVHVNSEVAAYLNNKKRRELADIENLGDLTLQVFGSESQFPEYLEIKCFDHNDRPLDVGL